jgi:phosphoesterase RecJ-like protein
MHRMYKKIYNEVKKAKNILLIPHKNPDGDALGSITAFMHFLKSLDKKFSAFCSTSIPSNLLELPYTEHIKTDPSIWKNPDFDLIIVFDTGELKRAGIDEFVGNMVKKPHIINIDHHFLNENFGDNNLVVPNASSTTEILYNFFKNNNIKIDPTIATCLLMGLTTDTSFFTNKLTTKSSLNIASRLVKYGANIKKIKELIFKNKTINSLKLWGLALSRLKKHEKIDLIYTYVTQDDLKKYNLTEDSSEGFSNFINNINESKVTLIFKEDADEKIKVSMRTNYEDIDVSKISKELGGGGHKKAAGFTIQGPLKNAAKRVFDTIMLNKYIK